MVNISDLEKVAPVSRDKPAAMTTTSQKLKRFIAAAIRCRMFLGSKWSTKSARLGEVSFPRITVSSSETMVPKMEITIVNPATRGRVAIIYSNGGMDVPASQLPQGFLDSWKVTPDRLKVVDAQ